MIRGEFTKSFGNGYKLIGYYESWLNEESNSSTVTVWAQLYVPYALYIGARTGNTIKLDNTTYTFNTIAINNDGGTPYYEPLMYEEAMFDVSHNADGTKSITLSVSFKLNATLSGTYYGTITATEVVELERNIQKASITSAPNFTDEDNPTIVYSNPSGNLIEGLEACISFTGYGDDIPYRAISKTGTSYTFNFTDAERKTLRNSITSGESKRLYFYIRTTIDGVSTTQRLQRTLTLINHTPTLSPTIIDTNESTIALTGDASTLIKSYSDVEVATGATARKEATITKQSIQCGSHTISGASGSIENVESGTFVFSATDSRGFPVSQTITRKIIQYIPLTCDLVAEQPTLEGGVKLTVSGNCFSGSFGAVANSLAIRLRYKEDIGEYGDWISIPVETTNNSYTAEMTLTIPDFDYRNTYTIQAMAEDKLETALSIERQVLALPIFDWGADDFNINGELRLGGSTTLRKNDDNNRVILSADEGEIYIRPNGSAVEEGQVVIYTDGSATFNDDVSITGVLNIGDYQLADYVIEYGDNGSYAYRKWYSGKLEAWRTATSSVSISFNMAYGSMWYNNAIGTVTTNGDASQFVSVQSVQITLMSSAGMPCANIRSISIENGAAKISYYMANPVQVTLNITPQVYILGTWK